MVRVGGIELDGEVPHHGLYVQLARPLPLTATLLTGHLLSVRGAQRGHELEVEIVGDAAHRGAKRWGQLQGDRHYEVGVGEATITCAYWMPFLYPFIYIVLRRTDLTVR